MNTVNNYLTTRLNILPADYEQTLFSFFDRVWEVVSDFFTWIARQIYDGYCFVRDFALSFFVETVPSAPSANLEPNSFLNMPQDQDAFLDQAFEIHQNALPADEAREFRNEIEDMMNFNEFAYVILRAYLFSNLNVAFPFLSYTEQAVERNLSVDLLHLRNRFNALAQADKTALLNKLHFGSLGEFNGSEEARRILLDLNGLSHGAHHGRPPFAQAVGALCIRYNQRQGIN